MNSELKDQEKKQPWDDNWGRLGGLFIIFFGVIFLLNQLGVEFFGVSPWLLFALVPVLAILFAAWQQYRENGRFTRTVFFILLLGLSPFAYVAAGIFGFDAALIWPVVLIGIGVGVLFMREDKNG